MAVYHSANPLSRCTNLVFEGFEPEDLTISQEGIVYKPWRSHTLSQGMSLQDKKDNCKEFKPQQ